MSYDNEPTCCGDTPEPEPEPDSGCGCGICGLLIFTACFFGFCSNGCPAAHSSTLASGISNEEMGSKMHLGDIASPDVVTTFDTTEGNYLLTKSFLSDGRGLSLRFDDPVSLNRDYVIEGAPVVGGIAIPDQWGFGEFLQDWHNRMNIAIGIAQILSGTGLSDHERTSYQAALGQLGWELGEAGTLLPSVHGDSLEAMTANPIIRAEFFAIVRELYARDIRRVLAFPQPT